MYHKKIKNMKNNTDETTLNQQGWFAGKQMNPNALMTTGRKRLITVDTTGLSLHIRSAKHPGTRRIYCTGPPGRAPVKTVVPDGVFKPPEQHPNIRGR